MPTTALRVDVGDADSVVAAPRRTSRSTLGGCDVLCANVGVQQFGAIDRLTEQDWAWVLDVNVLGMVRTVREFLPLLRARTGWRRIVLTASSSVLAPGCAWRAYQTSKFAVMGFGETLREELARGGHRRDAPVPGRDDDAPSREQRLARPAHARRVGAASRRTSTRCSRTGRWPTATSSRPSTPSATSSPTSIADEPYVLTHGSYRPVYEQRRAAMDAGVRSHGERAQQIHSTYL